MAIVGRKNAGKTTLLVLLAAALVRRGLDVATLKHGHHPAAADQEGKDTWRHYHEGRAGRVLIEAPGQRVLFERTSREEGPVALARRYLADADIILVEGFTRHPIPKIEVHRSALAAPPRMLAEPSLPGPWVALLTDDPAPQPPCLIYYFSDTSWLNALTRLAMEQSLPLSAAP
jgi:molybdopterin-guanine dinucleotide biosynthesis protein B